MKKIAAVLLLLTSSAFAAEMIKRGAPVSDARPTPLADVIKSPEAFTEKAVVVEGTVNNVCTNKGCWMELDGMRVTFKDYGFFVPKTSKGYAARIEGVTKVEKVSKEEAEHLKSEGATETSVTFIASGVELTKK